MYAAVRAPTKGKRRKPTLAFESLQDVLDLDEENSSLSQRVRDIINSEVAAKLSQVSSKPKSKPKPKSQRKPATSKLSGGVTKKVTKRKGAGASNQNGVIVLTKKIKDPERFLLSMDTWSMLTSVQLGQQCKMVGIPCGGSKDVRCQRLVNWKKDPVKFEKAAKRKEKQMRAKKNAK